MSDDTLNRVVIDKAMKDKNDELIKLYFAKIGEFVNIGIDNALNEIPKIPTDILPLGIESIDVMLGVIKEAETMLTLLRTEYSAEYDKRQGKH